MTPHIHGRRPSPKRRRSAGRAGPAGRSPRDRDQRGEEHERGEREQERRLLQPEARCQQRPGADDVRRARLDEQPGDEQEQRNRHQAD